VTITIRNGFEADNAVCGRIVGTAAGASVYAERLPHAQMLFEDVSALPLDGKLRLIAEIAGEPAGFADFTLAKSHIKYLFVLPGAQGGGIGSALLDTVQELAGGAISVHVLAVNDVGFLWYLRRGFRVVNGWAEPFEGKVTAWLRLVRAP
jgi:GNAT superfamily N-acetyltransferase